MCLLFDVSMKEHEPWCKKYMELYQELRENWERIYWDEGYSKKHGQERASYDSAEDDDEDFSPYRFPTFRLNAKFWPSFLPITSLHFENSN